MMKKLTALLLAGAMMASLSGCFFMRQENSRSESTPSSSLSSSQEEVPDPTTPGGAVELCQILGKEETLRRIQQGIQQLTPQA